MLLPQVRHFISAVWFALDAMTDALFADNESMPCLCVGFASHDCNICCTEITDACNACDSMSFKQGQLSDLLSSEDQMASSLPAVLLSRLLEEQEVGWLETLITEIMLAGEGAVEDEQSRKGQHSSCVWCCS